MSYKYSIRLHGTDPDALVPNMPLRSETFWLTLGTHYNLVETDRYKQWMGMLLNGGTSPYNHVNFDIPIR